ncbi:MAG: hypothetical protein JW814_01690 [Candidatus Krumholzibacteriota bacterium]|nr:hypothetical protein [Candidatus Krumholzibacteriota bacterium]
MNRSVWPEHRTAFLVFHGVGNQYPLATIDRFARSLVELLEKRHPGMIAMEHKVAGRDDGGRRRWYDNYITIKYHDSGSTIDIYEYYWANLTENVMKLSDLQRWVWQVASGAEKFYERNSDIGKKYGDESVFFTRDGRFKKGNYRSFLLGAVGILPIYKAFWIWLSSLVSRIPVAGGLVKWIVDLANRMTTDSLTNVIADVAVYNSIDPKSSFYAIRRDILGGAVDALRHLVELPGEMTSRGRKEAWSPYYGRIILAGHSLGSQIAFDAVNRLTQMISMGEIDGVAGSGEYIGRDGEPYMMNSGAERHRRIQEVLCGLVTFGSPLDKIAFFLREQAPEEQFLRGQMLENFHSFKQKKWFDDSNAPYLLDSPFKRIFDDIRWYNFHDEGDPISGHLDYYDKVRNIRCSYRRKGRRFTHGEYWSDPMMFELIADDFIYPERALKHSE